MCGVRCRRLSAPRSTCDYCYPWLPSFASERRMHRVLAAAGLMRRFRDQVVTNTGLVVHSSVTEMEIPMTRRIQTSAHLTAMLALALVLSGLASWGRPRVALAYNCNAVCSGYHRWDGGTVGGATRLTQAALVSTDPGGGWIETKEQVCDSYCTSVRGGGDWSRAIL